MRTVYHIAACEEDPDRLPGAFAVLDMEPLPLQQPRTDGGGGHALHYLGMLLEGYRDCGALADQRDPTIPSSLRERCPAAGPGELA